MQFEEKNRIAAALFLVLAVPSVLVAQTIDEIRAKVSESRQHVPAYLATIKESISVSGKPRDLGQGELSWGDRDGERSYEIAYEAGKFRYETRSYYGNNLNGLPPLHKSWVLENGAVTSDEPTIKTGEIQKLRHLDEIPSSFCFWQAGLPVDEMIMQLGNTSIGPSPSGRVKVRGEFQRMLVAMEFDPSHKWGLVRISFGSADEVVSEVTEWTSIGDWPFPKRIESRQQIEGGLRIANRTYLIERLESLPKGTPFTLKWKDGTRVYDRINDRVLTVKDGKLLGDSVFDKNTRATRSSKSATFLIASSIGTLAVLLLATRLLRRDKKNSLLLRKGNIHLEKSVR